MPTPAPVRSAITRPVRFMSCGLAERGGKGKSCGEARITLRSRHADSRFLLRIRLDLLLSGRDAHRAARRACGCDGGMAAFSARTDFPSPGVGDLAVQSL